MTSLLLCFSLAIIAAGYLPQLPPPIYIASASPLVFLLLGFFAKSYPPLKILLALVAGAIYGICSGYMYLAQQLDPDLVGREIVVEGQVIGLQEEDSRRQLFSLKVSRAYTSGENNYRDFPRRIKLSSYGKLRVKTGEQWRLLVKLKRPRGLVNPAGYDYQVSLLRRGIGATGYVKSSQGQQLLQRQPEFSLDVMRYDLQQWLLQTSQSPEKGILLALLVGDTSMVDKQHWGEMLKTGTNHLIAISGLHLGFFAIVGFFIGTMIGRLLQLLWRSCPAMYVGYLLAIGFALCYSIIAGLNIPTLRTLIMLAVVQWALLWRRSFRGRDTLLLALVLVLLYDPLAAFDIGFWLSFGALSLLLFCFAGRVVLRQNSSHVSAALYHFNAFIKSQWVMFIGLLVPLVVLVHSLTFLAPPANFIAIPLVTFFVVPCLIFAALLHFFPGAISTLLERFFLHCAEGGLALLHQWLDYLLNLSSGKLTPLVTINPWAVAIAAIGAFLVLQPRGLGNRWLGMLAICFALMIPQRKLPALQMLVFDVGQGTAVLLRTPHHQLLYDTGPVYTEHFDAGSAVLVPYLQSQGLGRVDRVVVSHSDSDHAGGLPGLLAATQVDLLLLGEPEKYQAAAPPFVSPAFPVANPSLESCHEAEPWQWDKVTFSFLTWPINPSDKANNHSCVLMVEYQGHRILLAGDIEKEVEYKLLQQQSLEPVTIVLAPHHGSRSSSTAAFVARTSPELVIYSAGYRNQHGHPHRDTIARYKAVGAMAANTAFTGALEFNWDAGRLLEQRQYRQFSRRYWFAEEGGLDDHSGF